MRAHLRMRRLLTSNPAPALRRTRSFSISKEATAFNYSADASAGSNIIMVMGDSPAWRAALLGTVAAGALWLYSARSARADCAAAGTVVNCTGTIAGNDPPFIANGGIVIPDGFGYERLNVNGITNNIAPQAANTDGIFFVRNDVGADIVINSNTGAFRIDTTAYDSRGIYTRAIGSITIDHTGDIVSGSGGIYALSILNSGGAVDITTSGTITSYNGSGIRATNGGTGALSITAYGDVTGNGSDGIYALNDFISTEGITIETASVTGGDFGIRARNLGNGAIVIETNGAVAGTDATGGIGIFAYNSPNSTEGISIESEAVTGGTTGIFARNYGGGDISIAVGGDIVGNTDDGIQAQNFGGGAIEIVVEATSSVTSNGAGADDFAIQIEGGPGDATVAGVLNGGAGGALRFDQLAALDDRLALHPTAAVNGNVLAGPGTDNLVFGGQGDGSFDVSRIGATQQFQSFELFAKEDSSHWTLTGTNAGIDNFTVTGGLLTVDGDLRNAAFDVTGGALGGTGIVGRPRLPMAASWRRAIPSAPSR